ncbi:hypothetical protein M404DRAFT_541416 [Pisolithus tinctorius Marx 270]|uniref:Uncharacterized protein n=1 Tax=Pisolithus tinctorius Marx 270 TaxID=870435 RepID=A0A0C3J759_PISTI|nr:hypothetical protein M404DRAFT_541416 [Pisolithus tinctorius Marx 270]
MRTKKRDLGYLIGITHPMGYPRAISRSDLLIRNCSCGHCFHLQGNVSFEIPGNYDRRPRGRRASEGHAEILMPVASACKRIQNFRMQPRYRCGERGT